MISSIGPCAWPCSSGSSSTSSIRLLSVVYSFVSSTVVWSLTAPVTIPFVDSSSNSTKLDSVVTWPPPGFVSSSYSTTSAWCFEFSCVDSSKSTWIESSSVSMVPSTWPSEPSTAVWYSKSIGLESLLSSIVPFNSCFSTGGSDLMSNSIGSLLSMIGSFGLSLPSPWALLE